MTNKLFTLPVIGLMALLSHSALAQSLFPFQQTEILGNNPGLLAAAEATQSAKADLLTGLTLANPEVSVSYMFGSKADVPNKTNIEVTQTFDFPTLSGARKRVAQADGQIQEAAYLAQRSQVALEVENAIIEYIYNHLRVAELEKQNALIQQMAKEAEAALKTGTITYPELNDTRLAAIAADQDLSTARMELASAESTLATLNGGTLPQALPQAWPEAALPHSADEWTQVATTTSPEILAMKGELHRATQEVSLRKKEGLPEFSIGYVNELVKEGDYHGAAIGLSLPLWGNRGRVKAAKASQAAAAVNLQTAHDNLRLTVTKDYERARMLLDIRDRYDKAYALAVADTEKYLQLALEKKTISSMEYLKAKAELGSWALRCLDATRDYQLARAALYAPTL